MRRMYSCVDSKTGYELILADASYNHACVWLANNGLEFENCESVSLYETRIQVKHEESGNRLEFLYDEERGYLLMVA